MRSPLVARPYGSEAVRDALIVSATELFAQFGPGSVSVRQIAAHAQVNHGLVHRHFGTKEALLSAVLDRLVRELAADLAKGRKRTAARKAFRVTRKQGTYWKILAHSLLEGRNPLDTQKDFPVMRALVQATRDGQASGRFDKRLDARAMTAATVAMGLGWILFEPFVNAATGMGDMTPKRRWREVSRIWRRMELIARPPGSPVS
jgi:AcrR family transcriptional regulator